MNWLLVLTTSRNASSAGAVKLGITSDEFDAVAGDLARSLDFFNVPAQEKGEVLGAFAGHKGEVTEGSLATAR